MRRMINRYRESVGRSRCVLLLARRKGREWNRARSQCGGDKSEEIERKPIHSAAWDSRLDQPPRGLRDNSLPAAALPMFFIPIASDHLQSGAVLRSENTQFPIEGVCGGAGYLLKRQKDRKERGTREYRAEKTFFLSKVFQVETFIAWNWVTWKNVASQIFW